MSKLTLRSNAKVNLSLDILGCEEKEGRFKGYHFVQSVMFEVTPQNTHGFQSDEITVEVEEAKEASIEIKCNNEKVPTDKTNLAYQAAALLLKQPKVTPRKITITIDKKIPLSSGLGGGASNAAATIRALQTLLNIRMTPEEMRLIAAEVGMDVPFFIEGGIALAEHYGEQMTQLPPVNGLAITLQPEESDLETKTEEFYSKIDLTECGRNVAKTADLIHAIKTNDPLKIHEFLHNDFETILGKPLPKNHHLSGAGPTIFILV